MEAKALEILGGIVMKQYYTVDGLFGDKIIFDANTGENLGYVTKGLFNDDLIFNNKGQNIGWAQENITGGKSIFIDDNNNKNDLFGGW